MDDETTGTAATPQGVPGEDGVTSDPAAALAEMRARVDEAARDIERLTSELEERTRALDDLETLADVLLGVSAGVVVVVRPDRRVRALSRGAAELFALDASHVGKALSSVVPDEVVAATRDALAAPDGSGEEIVAGDWAVVLSHLPAGGAVLVLREK
jgi:nitrogen fixation/metabolism regulation signal transduction histidine kinase